MMGCKRLTDEGFPRRGRVGGYGELRCCHVDLGVRALSISGCTLAAQNDNACRHARVGSDEPVGLMGYARPRRDEFGCGLHRGKSVHAKKNKGKSLNNF